uniref:hypothetical protein n=2 Tax=Lactobacillus delbrueckii TaxID=1584 RepID=UPI0035CFDBB7
MNMQRRKTKAVWAVNASYDRRTISYADYSGINLGTIFGSQLSLLVSSSRVERIVKDEAIGTLIRSQI